MAENATRTLADLKDLAQTAAPEPEIAPPAPKLDAAGRAYATGRRKEAVARVWLKPGSGRSTVNGRSLETYFARPVLRMLINQPFEAAHRAQQFDLTCTVAGGGLSGQAGAVRHGISRALIAYDPTLRPPLKSGGFLTAICAKSSAKSTASARPAAVSSSPSVEARTGGSCCRSPAFNPVVQTALPEGAPMRRSGTGVRTGPPARDRARTAVRSRSRRRDPCGRSPCTPSGDPGRRNRHHRQRCRRRHSKPRWCRAFSGPYGCGVRPTRPVHRPQARRWQARHGCTRSATIRSKRAGR